MDADRARRAPGSRARSSSAGSATVSPRALIGWSSLAAAGALALRHNVPSVPLALALSGFAGVTSVASSVGAETLAMQSVRDEFRGRVFGSLDATLGLLSLARRRGRGPLAEAGRDRDDAQRRDRADPALAGVVVLVKLDTVADR